MTYLLELRKHKRECMEMAQGYRDIIRNKTTHYYVAGSLELTIKEAEYWEKFVEETEQLINEELERTKQK
jgi:hypothetical protein